MQRTKKKKVKCESKKKVKMFKMFNLVPRAFPLNEVVKCF